MRSQPIIKHGVMATALLLSLTAVAVGSGRVWVDQFPPPPFGSGPSPVNAHATTWCSADEFTKGRVAAGPGPWPPLRIGGPFDIGDRVEWYHRESDYGGFLKYAVQRGGAFESATLLATALVPVAESECLRFNLIEVSKDGCRRLDCVRLSRTPPKEERLGQVEVPFAEAFAVARAGDDYRFVTASGRVFGASRGKSGLPTDIYPYPSNGRDRVFGVMTDTRDGAAFLFTKPAGEEIRFKRLDSDAKPVSLPFASPEDFADPLGAASVMVKALVDTKTIKPIE